MPRAIQFSATGATDVLRLAEVPDPEPGPGQVRLTVRAAGVNPFDWKVLHGFVPGLPKAFPAGLGNDVAGVVDALGEGVASVAVGDAVLGQSATPSYATSRSRRRTAWSRSPAICRGRSRPGSAARAAWPGRCSSASASPRARPCSSTPPPAVWARSRCSSPSRAAPA